MNGFEQYTKKTRRQVALVFGTAALFLVPLCGE
jgi:hypothetical protein